MMQIVPFEPWHLVRLQLQPAQAYLQPRLRDGAYADLCAEPGLAWTGLFDGEVRGAAGIRAAPGRPGVGIAWALFGRVPAGQKAVWIEITRRTRAVVNFAFDQGFHRLETLVDASFDDGHRFIRLLGFAEEGRHPRYLGDRDMVSYGRLAQ